MANITQDREQERKEIHRRFRGKKTKFNLNYSTSKQKKNRHSLLANNEFSRVFSSFSDFQLDTSRYDKSNLIWYYVLGTEVALLLARHEPYSRFI